MEIETSCEYAREARIVKIAANRVANWQKIIRGNLEIIFFYIYP